MSISTLNFTETKLVDYFDRRDGIVSTSSKENNPNGKWKLTYPNGEVLSSNFDFFPEEDLKNGSIQFFVLDESDVRWIHETMKLSVLKSFTDFVKYRENKRIYIREVQITSDKPSEGRRVFTEEVLEIIRIILKQQNSRIEEWNGLLENYQLEWKREHVHNSINMETFNSVLEEFNINKALITIVPDPVYEMSEREMLEFGRQTAVRLSPHGTWLFDSSHAIFNIFQSIVYAVNWKENGCESHEKCRLQKRKKIIEVMKEYQNTPEGSLIPIGYIKEAIKSIIKCFCNTATSSLFNNCLLSLNAMDDSPNTALLCYDQDYQRAVYAFDLPNYDSFAKSSIVPKSPRGKIPVWMTRFLLLTGWTQQFFDKETVDLANVIVRLIMKKVPVESISICVSLLKSVLASISGAKMHWNPTVDTENSASEAHQKMLKKTQERSEKLRQRKEQSKLNKAEKTSSTKGPEFVGASLLEEQEYPDSKLTIRKNESFEIGNVPNVLSLDNTGVLETVALENSSPEELDTKPERVMTEEEEQKEELESEVVKALRKEVERLKTFEEKAGAIDELEKEFSRLNRTVLEHQEKHHKMVDDAAEKSSKLKGLLGEKTKKVDELEDKLKSLEIEVKRLKGFERTVDEMKNEKKEMSSKLKELKEEKKKLKSSLDEKTRKLDEVKNEMKLRDLEMNEMRSEMSRMKNQPQNQEKLLKEKETVIERFKVEAENLKSRISEKDAEIARKNDELSNSTETNESLVFQLSRLEEEKRKSKIEDQEKNEIVRKELLKNNEQLRTANRRLAILNEEQERRVQNLLDRLAKAPSPTVSIQEEKPESVQSQIWAIKNLVDKLSNSEDSEEARQFRITLQRLRNIKDRFQNKEQLKLAKTMTDKLIQMSNRSEIRELALYEYQQYEANFQNYTQLVDLNIEKMKETRDCSLYSPLPKPPAFSDRFMNEYWLECDKKKKELEMDISDSECLICFFEMNSDQKTLKCDHCNKITHLKCASKWLQIHRSCPHCRREQLDPEEFPALS